MSRMVIEKLFYGLPFALFDELVLPEPWYWDWDRAIEDDQWPGINRRDAAYRDGDARTTQEAYGWIAEHYGLYTLAGNFPKMEFDNLEEAVRFCYMHVMLGVPNEKL